jgi:multiple sugar transport system ATP-binding protein
MTRQARGATGKHGLASGAVDIGPVLRVRRGIAHGRVDLARITIERLGKGYRDAQALALDGLDLELGDGELLVLVGPSGCGKSTALRLVAGLEQPDAGRIVLDGRDLAGVAPQERDIAMVFQGYALYPHLRVREIVAFPLKMRGVNRGERERKVLAVAELLGLGGLLDRRPAELSGGEQQRVAMARAIVRSPKAFLFDEPLSNLDAKLRAELRVELSALVRRLGTTSIYVTHDQAEAMTMGDRVAVLRAGRLQQVAPPRQVYEQPANRFVASFLGTPTMNLLELECAEQQARAPGIAIALPTGLPARRRLVCGIRPEHLELGPLRGSRGSKAPPANADEPGASRGRTAETAQFATEILAVEPLGAESYVHLGVEGTTLRARVPGLDVPRVGERVEARVRCNALHWFDAESGTRLELQGRP